MQKNGRSYYDYKNHICIDVDAKFIRSCNITPASVHDSKVFTDLLDTENSSKDVYADSAYRSNDHLEYLKAHSFREHIQRKGCRNKALTYKESKGNLTRSRIRSRVEHIFGVQAMMMGNTILRNIGIVRATTKIYLRNLAYNLSLFSLLSQNS